MEFEIVRAKSEHIEKVGQLFDLYRQFYSYNSEIKISTQYIKERLANDESVIFVALNKKDQALGFVQLYETFGSLDLGKIILLYDLYVKK